jgi:hypothetical protein
MNYTNYRKLWLALAFVVSLANFSNAQSVESHSFPFGCGDGWDTTFSPNGADDQVNSIVSDGTGGFYVGGEFRNVQGIPASGIARWNGTQWSALGSGINGSVYAIAVSGSDVYVAGSFSMAGGVPAKNVARWNGSAWSALGAGLGEGTHFVRTIAIYGGNVFLVVISVSVMARRQME